MNRDSFTDERGAHARVPRALSLRSLTAEEHRELSERLGIERSDVEALERELSDTEETLQRLRQVPPLALAVLEVVADAGGRIDVAELSAVLKDRFGEVRASPRAIALLRSLGLLHAGGAGSYAFVALIQPQAATIARLVPGVSHPVELPEDAPFEPELFARERDALALATLSLHRMLRFTAAGELHRARLRSFAKGLGPTEETVGDLLQGAIKAGLFAEEGEPPLVVERLLDAAERGLHPPPASLLGTVDALLPAEGWVAAAALAPHLAGFGTLGRRAVPPEGAVGDACRGRYIVRTHAGRVFVARPARPPAKTGDGHVTPNLEVLLGAAAHPEIVVQVGLFAELVRLDRVLAFRITRASVAAGLSTGTPLDVFLSALDRVGRHAVPDNVRHTVRDFAARVGTVRRVLSVEVPEASTAALIRELGDRVVAVPRPGLLLVSEGTEPVFLSGCLDNVGVAAAFVDAGRAPGANAAAKAEAARFPKFRPPGLPDSALRHSVLSDMARGFERSATELERLVSMLPAHAELDAVQTARRARADLARTGAPKSVLNELDRLAALLQGAPLEIEAWAAKLPAEAAAAVRKEARSPFALVPYASLPAVERARVLLQSRSWPALVRGCEEAMARGLSTPEGVRVIRSLSAMVASAEAGMRSRAGASTPGSVASVAIDAGPDLEAKLRSVIAAAPDAILRVFVRGRDGSTEYVIAEPAFRRRGNETVLLAVARGTEENIVILLSTIERIELDPGAVPGGDEPPEADEHDRPPRLLDS